MLDIGYLSPLLIYWIVLLSFFFFREKALAFLPSSPDSQIHIDGRKVQIRMASALMEVEWEILLPEPPECFLVPSKHVKETTSELIDSFQDRISTMLEEVLIPDSQQRKALAVIDAIRNLMSRSELTPAGHTLHIHMFRNCYLQCKSSVRGGGVLLLHLYYTEGMN